MAGVPPYDFGPYPCLRMDLRPPPDPEPGLAERCGIEPPLTLHPVTVADPPADGAAGVCLGPPQPGGGRQELVGPALLFPGAQGLVDGEGRRLEATFLRRGANLERFPFPPPERMDPAALERAEPVPTLVFLPYLEFDHFGHWLTETAAWLGPLLDPGLDWLAGAGEGAVLMVSAQAAPALGELERLLPAAAGRWRSSASLEAPLRAERVLLPVPSLRIGHSIGSAHPRHLRLLLERTLGPTVRLPPPTAGAPDGSRLYLSRSRLDRSFRQILGEEALEQELRRRGWRIAWPETQPLAEQLQQLRDASVIAGPRSSALHLLLYFGRSLRRRSVISLCASELKLSTTYQMQASLQGLPWLALGCLRADPDGSKPRNVECDLLLQVEPAQLAEQLDRLADELDQPSTPPRNKW